MTYSTQPMEEFLELLRTWAVASGAKQTFVDKIDELIDDYGGESIEKRIKDAQDKATEEAEKEYEVELNEAHEENERLSTELRAAVDRLEQEKTRRRMPWEKTRHRMPWEL